jgi:hypothetical protein
LEFGVSFGDIGDFGEPGDFFWRFTHRVVSNYVEG